MTWAWVIVALALGMTLPLQVVINGRLRTTLDDPVRAALASLLVSVALLLTLSIATWRPLPAGWATASPWWVWTGGLIGALYLTASLLLIARLGAAFLFALLVVGQMLSSVLVDHYGWLGVPVHAINPWRLLGAAFLVAGVVLIRRF